MKSRSVARPENDDEQPRLAVLIDADNAQPAVIEGLLAETAKYGVASVKRIYGDFTSTRMTQWKQALLKHSINPVQQFAYTSGKNATDSSLIIDAMDLMYTGRFDGVCLVSSDSDFTRLAQRLREEGLTVYGFGERKTPDPFVQACDKFIYTEILREPPEEKKSEEKKGDEKKAEPVAELPKLRTMVLKALEATAREDGWATLSALGSQLTRSHPDFDPRNYGVAKLSELMRRQGYLETKDVAGGDGHNVQVHVRRKPAAANKS